MKSLIFAALLLLLSDGKAQTSISVNLGTTPMWGPAGYTEVRYYYLPGIKTYYDIHSSLFVYRSKGAWIYNSNLPIRNRDYDLFNGYKVVLTDYQGLAPYLNFRAHKKLYPRRYYGESQKTLGAKPGSDNLKGMEPRKHE